MYCLRKEHNTVALARAQPTLVDSEFIALTIRPLHNKLWKASFLFLSVFPPTGIEPDDLSSVHLNTIPQRDRTYSILSKKKKRRPNKKSKQTTAPSTPKQIAVGSSSMDALTPTFAACNLNYTAPKESPCNENQSVSLRPRNSPRRTTHYTGSNATQNRDSATTNANHFDGSGAESSGYHSASSLSTASSDSEYSDSEAGQTARLRYCTDE